MRLILICFIVMAGVSAAPAQDQATFEKLKASFESKLAGLSGGRAVTALAGEYTADLRRSYEFFRDQGSIDGVVAARDELKRFKEAGTLASADLVARPASLKKLQEKYLQQFAGLSKKREASEKKLRENYLKTLDRLKRACTRQDKIALAVAVAEEMTRVEAGLSAVAEPGGAVPVKGIPKEGLVLQYDFNDENAEFIADHSGNKNVGMPMGAKWTEEGRNGGAVYLLEETDSIKVDDSESLNPDTELSMAFWVKVDGSHGEGSRSWSVILTKPGATHRQYSWFVRKDGLLEFSTRGPADGQPFFRVSRRIKLGEWQHCAVVVDHKKHLLRLYLDGSRVLETVTPFDSFRQNAGPLHVGRHPYGPKTVIGAIDDLFIYTRALSDAEIHALYQESGGESPMVEAVVPKDPKAPYPGAVAFQGHWYKLFEGRWNWEKAKAKCESLGGHLAVIETPEENAFVRSLVTYYGVWLGGYLDKSEGTWKWHDGKPISWTDWNTGEPSNHLGREAHLELFWTGKWNDANLDGGSSNGFLCEWE